MQVDISEITAITKDRETSIRLYKGYKKKHPNKAPDWVVQKIIMDLQRENGTVGKIPKIRTRQAKTLFSQPNQESEFYWFCGICIKKGSWADRNRLWVVLASLFLAALLSVIDR